MGDRNNVIGAPPINKSNGSEQSSIVVDLYIGVFFDGTNNNKYQVMLGKMFRRKEILENARKRQSIELPPSVSELLKMSRAEVEENYPNCFTKSELEFLYFGYGAINDTKDNSYDTFIEKKSAITLEGKSQNELSARPDNEKDCELLQNTAEHLAVQNENKEAEKFKGAAAQNATYTNVAILESLYKCENKNEKNTERHISIYVEGSGSDMQFEASTEIEYKLTIGLAGLGLGTGPTGVVSKIRKASSMVQRLIDQYKCTSDVTVKYHFDLFGFSRGSTCARIMAYLINPDPNNTKKAYEGGIKGKDDEYLLLTSRKKEFLPIDDKTTEKEIRFMGLFDTVSSIGVKDEDSLAELLAKILDNAIRKVKDPQKKDVNTIWNSIKPYINPPLQYLGLWADYHLNTGVLDKMGEAIGNTLTYVVDTKLMPIINRYETYVKNNAYRDKGTEDISVLAPKGKTFLHENNVKDYGLWATKLAKNVVHICALDEYRKNFALVDIESSITAGTGTEIFIPGCHTDIGGGAAIGQEDSYIVNKVPKRRFLLSHGQKEEDLASDNLIEISSESLKRLGWLPKHGKPIPEEFKETDGRVKDTFLWQYDNTIYTENEASTALDVAELGATELGATALGADVSAVANYLYYLYKKRWDNIIMYRHVKPGYSNLSLKVLREKANAAPFNPIPYAYRIPLELNDFYKRIIGTEKGRHFFFPNEKDYQRLRSEYLHFSFDEQWKKTVKGGGVLVNAPEFTAKDNFEVLSRIIYKGEKDCNTEKRFHLFDYNEDADDVQVFGDTKNEINVKNIPEMITMVNHDGILIDDRESPRKYDKSNDHLFI
jgi:hypothetical protein